MSTSAQAVNALKNKMQSVRDELDKYRDLYEDKCRQHQDEINKTNEVSQLDCVHRRNSLFSLFFSSPRSLQKLDCIMKQVYPVVKVVL